MSYCKYNKFIIICDSFYSSAKIGQGLLLTKITPKYNLYQATTKNHNIPENDWRQLSNITFTTHHFFIHISRNL